MRPVLIVEANPVVRITLKALLSLRFPSIEVEEACNGEGALSLFRKTHPFLIFMDIGLPDGNGLELTRAIKEADPGTEVIILTTYDIPEHRREAFSSGASDFFTKGNVKVNQITSWVAFALETKKGLERSAACS
ncbi:MAG: response regulator transcription factor [Syntrophobacteraceae bacterium]|nr:response regulator transcription factor [Syntrophobacteraceae bacterium]